MRDPTIPRHRARGTRGVTTGRLVYYNETTIALRDKHGNSWSLSSVSFAVGHWGSVHEGVEKLPRPWRYDEKGQATVRGDLLLVDFVDGDPSLPIVLGVVRSTTPTDFLAYNHRGTGGKSNRLRLRLAPLDADGNETGEIRVKMADDDSGTVEVEASDGLLLEVGTDLDNPSTTIRLVGNEATIESASIKLGAAAAEAIIKGNTFQALYNAHTHMTGVGPSAPPIPLLTGTELSTKSKTE